MKNIPNKIYLVIGTGDCEDFKELREVTWCEDSIFNSDLQFISISFLREKLENLKQQRINIFENSTPQTDLILRAQIKLLNDIIYEI